MSASQFSYLQKAWGGSKDQVSMDDVRTAIAETIAMDDEHGAFWVGTGDEDYVLEVWKDLTTFWYFPGKTDVRKQLPNWEMVEQLFELLLGEDYEQVSAIMENV